MYSKRLESKKAGDEVGNQIYKLLLNSLYGRLGMKTDLAETVEVSHEHTEVIESFFQVTSTLSFKNCCLLTISSDEPHIQPNESLTFEELIFLTLDV